jgi:hypothetical protein
MINVWTARYGPRRRPATRTWSGPGPQPHQPPRAGAGSDRRGTRWLRARWLGSARLRHFRRHATRTACRVRSTLANLGAAGRNLGHPEGRRHDAQARRVRRRARARRGRDRSRSCRNNPQPLGSRVSEETGQLYVPRTTPTVRRALAEMLLETVAAAADEFITGPLLQPDRVGKQLLPPLDDRFSARRGTSVTASMAALGAVACDRLRRPLSLRPFT